MQDVSASPLGKKSTYVDQYHPSSLFALPREPNRRTVGINIQNLPFTGVDIWNCYDFTWLNSFGIPQYAMLTILVPCQSPNLIESKSLKLYLYSFANSKFKTIDDVKTLLTHDLSLRIQLNVKILIAPVLSDLTHISAHFPGFNLDTLDVTCDKYEVTPSLLKFGGDKFVSEQLCSDLLKSNCLVTGKPDWASVQITYTGRQIDHKGLLQYIVSYRNHQGFHEQCIEQIFNDILKYCQPGELAVMGRYTRRGSLDINPLRTMKQTNFTNIRLYRQ